MLVALAVAMVPALPVPANASRVVVTGSADIRVWVEEANDVFGSYDDVVVTFAAARDCYATLFVVDTDGFVHVVYPFSPRDRAWIRGGRHYRYTARELGLDRLYGRGIAYVFAVGSPRPFEFGPWGDGVFVGRYGFRVYGDPYIASRTFYLSLLPGRLDYGFVAVSSARFYIGGWVRYPAYLCRGHHGVRVRVGDYCRECAHIYDGYRHHVSAPHEVLDPRVKFKANVPDGAIRRASDSERTTAVRRATDSREWAAKRVAPIQKARVVSTSRSVKKSKRTYQDVYKKKVARTPTQVARARGNGAKKVSTTDKRGVNRASSSSYKGKPTSSQKRAAKTKTGSARAEEKKASKTKASKRNAR
jgi:hypothetical protein